MARRRGPLGWILLCGSVLSIFVLTGCAASEEIHVGPSKKYGQSVDDNGASECELGLVVDGLNSTINRCNVYLTKSKSFEIARVIHDHPLESDVVQKAVVMISDTVCSMIMKSKLAGRACALTVDMAAASVRDVLEEVYADRSCLHVSDGLSVFSLSLDASNDPNLCH